MQQAGEDVPAEAVGTERMGQARADQTLDHVLFERIDRPDPGRKNRGQDYREEDREADQGSGVVAEAPHPALRCLGDCRGGTHLYLTRGSIRP